MIDAPLLGLVEPGVLDGGPSLMSKRLKHGQVGAVKGAKRIALDVEDTDHFTLGANRHRKLREGLAPRHLKVARLFPYILNHQRLARPSHPTCDSILPNSKARRGDARHALVPQPTCAHLIDELVALDQADANMVQVESLLNQLNDLLQQHFEVQDGSDAAAHLGDDPELLGPVLLSLVEPAVFHRHPDLVANREQEIHLLLPEALHRPAGNGQHAFRLALGGQGDAGQGPVAFSDHLIRCAFMLQEIFNKDRRAARGNPGGDDAARYLASEGRREPTMGAHPKFIAIRTLHVDRSGFKAQNLQRLVERIREDFLHFQ